MEEANVSEIAQEILDHLRKHPQAQDTLEGIGQWWVPSRLLSGSAAIKEALDELVDAGLITELLGKDAHISYRITNPNALKAIDEAIARRATNGPAANVQPACETENDLPALIDL
jgi:hypothetical protein